MLRADPALARRVELAECRLVSDMAQSAARHRAPGAVFVAPVGAGAAVFAGAGSPLTKWVGLGLDGPLDEERVIELESEFRRRKAAPRVELCAFADPSAAELFSRRGYRLVGHEHVLGMPLDRAFVELAQHERDAASGEVTIERIGRDQARAWLDVVATGFLHPDGSAATAPTESFDRAQIETALADSLEVSGFELYLARLAGHVAGGAGVRRSEGIAQLCGASTLPEHRRRGVQTALLRARLLDAAREDCDLALVTTEPESKSQRNAEARGFSLLFARSIWVLEG